MKPKILASMALFGLLAVAVACYAGPLGLFSPRLARTRHGMARRASDGVAHRRDRPGHRHAAPVRAAFHARHHCRGRTQDRRFGDRLARHDWAGPVVGGFWLAGRARRRVVLAAAALALFAIGTGVVLADIPSPDGIYRGSPRPPFPFPP